MSNLRRSHRAGLPGLRLTAALLIAAASAACSSLIDRIPTGAGGLPSTVPERPAEQPEYPAVHDAPPARDAKPMSDQELDRLKGELATIRDRQEERAAASPPNEPVPQNDDPAGAKPAKKPKAPTKETADSVQ